MNFELLEERIGYKFKNIHWLETALTHSSYANEHGVKSYERLEFLGDSVLGFVTAEFLYKNFPDLPEGKLTKYRAELVCEKSLYAFSKELELGDFMLLSHGEMRTGGKNRPSILADMFESVAAAIYKDSGNLKEAEKFILRFIEPASKNLGKRSFKDYKTTLQEIIQQNPEEKISYELIGQSGPDHNKHFVVQVKINNNIVGKGGGKSKKEAEQQAARVALELMGY
ncbi:MAG: ribonuclease III [Ruminococcaceae bacterium]|nr:ribonuclease III [Oscillospiraceae bacterium]